MASITLDVSEYDRMRARISSLEDELNKLRNKDPELPPESKHLQKIIECGRTIIRFAIANLHPENTRDWPFSDLREFVKGYQSISSGANAKDWVDDTLRFADEAEQWQKQRKKRDEDRDR